MVVQSEYQNPNFQFRSLRGIDENGAREGAKILTLPQGEELKITLLGNSMLQYIVVRTSEDAAVTVGSSSGSGNMFSSGFPANQNFTIQPLLFVNSQTEIFVNVTKRAEIALFFA